MAVFALVCWSSTTAGTTCTCLPRLCPHHIPQASKHPPNQHGDDDDQPTVHHQYHAQYVPTAACMHVTPPDCTGTHCPQEPSSLLATGRDHDVGPTITSFVTSHHHHDLVPVRVRPWCQLPLPTSAHMHRALSERKIHAPIHRVASSVSD